MSKLVIVESPAKAKTIKKYLGKNYEVLASNGHIRDLPKARLAVDVENNFEPQYINIKGKGTLIKSLKQAAKKSDAVYLATDPDREGEAISWHLAHILELNEEDQNRVTFNEITKTGIKNGMSHPRSIDMDLVDAQQARRVLDRLVGYKLSPFLWKKVRPGLSAGRVQSVAVRLVVDREEEIEAFKPEEYWTIDAILAKKGQKTTFSSKYYGMDGKKKKIKNQEEANEVLKIIENQDFAVGKVKKGKRKRSPAPPFITSTLQQEASRRLGFQAYRTMKVAQELYEGVTIENMGAIGLITYMRTDSLRISDEARNGAYTYIRETYGEQHIPSKDRIFKSKSNAQDAHEAIRPSMPDLTPARVQESLTSDQFKLYKLIWERFIASQMADAQLNTMSVDIHAANCQFRSSGFTIAFKGFMELYVESKDEETEKESRLPDLKENDLLDLKDIKGNQHFTQPPPRFTEASLIKAMEEKGIGRPSTYAPTISTIVNRNYVERDAKLLKPTILGQITTQLMKEQFPDIVDYQFTAGMEEDLDKVENGNIQWKYVISDFYKDFAENLETAEKAMEGKRMKVPDEETDEVCELCGKPMVIKFGRFGKFMACSGYPDCKNTKKVVVETPGICLKCGGKIVEQKSKKGRKFYGCSNYPNCDFMTWDQPLKEQCPQCSSTLFKKNGKNGKIYCMKEGCGYERGLKED